MRRLEVPEDMQKKYGLPSLGGPNSLTKQAIFGLKLSQNLWFKHERSDKHARFAKFF